MLNRLRLINLLFILFDCYLFFLFIYFLLFYFIFIFFLCRIVRFLTLQTDFDCEWQAKTIPGITAARKFEFNTTNEESIVRLFRLATDERPYREVVMKMEESEEVKKNKKLAKKAEKERMRLEKLEQKKRKTEEKASRKNKPLELDDRSLSDEDNRVEMTVTVTNSRSPREKKKPKRLIMET